MMYFSWNPGTVVDEENCPIASGRVTVFVHDSNVLADIYTMEGMDYTPLANPLFLDDYGRLSATVFAELGVYDVKIEKNNGDGTYEDFDHFEIGIDAKLDQVGRDSVADIDALQDLDPSVCSDVVTVEAYPRRDYLWDKDAVDTPDGGVVVASDVSSTGRWILLTDCPYIKSSVYGVIDGNTTNINALFNFPRVIGSMNMVTPTTIWLEPGNYDLGVTYVCTKKLAIGPDTCWTGSIMVPCDIEILGNTAQINAIGNIIFTDRNCTAHSSWYFNVNDFWHCGADTLIVDSINSFADTKLRSTVDLQDKTVFGKESLVTEYVNGAYFKVGLTSHVPEKFFSTSDFVQVLSAGIGDEIFKDAGTWDPGSIAQGHHVLYSQVPELVLFRNADRWYLTMNERKARLGQHMSLTSLDFQGRTCTVNIDTSVWSAVQNVQADGGITVKNTVLLDSVKGDIDVNAEISASVTLQDCNVRITGTPVNFSGLTAIDSAVTVPGTVGIDPANTMITMYGGHFNGIIALSSAHAQTFTASKSVDFRNVSFETAFTWKVNRLNMQSCTGPVSIDLYPVLVSGSYVYSVNLEKDIFIGDSRVWFTLPRGVFNYSPMDGNCVLAGVRIVDCAFNTTDAYGLKMLRWNPGSLNRLINDNPGTWEYHGNSGNCPRLSPGAVYNGDSHWTQYTQGAMQWCKYVDALNIWAPYAYYLDGSINYAEDGSGIANDASAGKLCMCMTTVNVAPLVLFAGYCNGQAVPLDAWDENANDLFIVKPAITNGTGNMPAPTTGYTYWYQQSLV